MPNLGRILPMVDKDHPPSERHGAASSEHRAESVWQRQLDGAWKWPMFMESISLANAYPTGGIINLVSHSI